MNSDFTVNLCNRRNITSITIIPSVIGMLLWRRQVKNRIGARVKKIEKYINNDTFMLTYGDAVRQILILANFSHSTSLMETLEQSPEVHPASLFGELCTHFHCVKRFSEKLLSIGGFCQRRFFVFNKNFFPIWTTMITVFLRRNQSDGYLQQSTYDPMKNSGNVVTHTVSWNFSMLYGAIPIPHGMCGNNDGNVIFTMEFKVNSFFERIQLFIKIFFNDPVSRMQIIKFCGVGILNTIVGYGHFLF